MVKTVERTARATRDRTQRLAAVTYWRAGDYRLDTTYKIDDYL